MKRSWKTSTLGLIALISLIGNAVNLLADGNPATSPDWAKLAPEIALAIGVIMARDWNKTSEDHGIVPKPVPASPPAPPA